MQVGPDDDAYERQADAVAAQVVARLSHGRPDQTGDVDAGLDVRSAPPALQRSAVGVGPDGGEVDQDTSAEIDRARTAGRPMEAGLQRSMEHAFGGVDFGAVRVHSGPRAQRLNAALSARAFTVGNDIFFSGALPDARSDSDRRVLAHELTHTLQQGAGTAQRSAIVQRMPSSNAVKQRSGKTSKSGMFKTTHTYNALLGSLDEYDNYLSSTAIANNTPDVERQLETIGTRLDRIVTASQAYLDKKDRNPAVATEAEAIIRQVPAEKRAARDVGAARLQPQNRTSNKWNQKWRTFLDRDTSTQMPMMADMRLADVTVPAQQSSDAGKNKQVVGVTNAKGSHGFFAEDDETGEYNDQIKYSNATGMLGEYGTRGEYALGNRSIAMSRLDQLLNAGVIARTERALMNGQFGTFMVGAKGVQAGKALMSNAVDSKDNANLARLLSRLHLIDLIAAQVDRHAGNYFIQSDAKGNVTGVTGIDLDMAWAVGDGSSGRGRHNVKQGPTTSSAHATISPGCRSSSTPNSPNGSSSSIPKIFVPSSSICSLPRRPKRPSSG